MEKLMGIEFVITSIVILAIIYFLTKSPKIRGSRILKGKRIYYGKIGLPIIGFIASILIILRIPGVHYNIIVQTILAITVIVCFLGGLVLYFLDK